MNVIVANEYQNQLNNLDVDVIKNVSGKYNADELAEMFKNFFYSKMILDVTALNNYDDFHTYDRLIHSLEADKIIFLFPEGSKLCTAGFLSKLISLGIYNFTTNITGVSYLLKKSNTLKDVEHILKMANAQLSQETGAGVTSMPGSKEKEVKKRIIGFKNVTKAAGSTSLIYILKKELSTLIGQENVFAIEIDGEDFSLFNDSRMKSVKADDLSFALEKTKDTKVVFVDLNKCNDTSFCTDVIYLIEPSTIKLNRLIRRNKAIFTQLADKKIVLNKSLLLNNDVFDFEKEAGVKIFYNLPPLDERKKNSIVKDFLSKLGVLNVSQSSNHGRIFGLFKR